MVGEADLHFCRCCCFGGWLGKQISPFVGVAVFEDGWVSRSALLLVLLLWLIACLAAWKHGFFYVGFDGLCVWRLGNTWVLMWDLVDCLFALYKSHGFCVGLVALLYYVFGDLETHGFLCWICCLDWLCICRLQDTWVFVALMDCVLGGWKTHGFSSGICCFDELCVCRLQDKLIFVALMNCVLGRWEIYGPFCNFLCFHEFVLYGILYQEWF